MVAGQKKSVALVYTCRVYVVGMGVEHRKRVVCVRLTEEEYARVVSAAEAEMLSAWLRRVVLAACEEGADK